jgi:hypothetical protein
LCRSELTHLLDIEVDWVKSEDAHSIVWV